MINGINYPTGVNYVCTTCDKVRFYRKCKGHEFTDPPAPVDPRDEQIAQLKKQVTDLKESLWASENLRILLDKRNTELSKLIVQDTASALNDLKAKIRKLLED